MKFLRRPCLATNLCSAAAPPLPHRIRMSLPRHVLLLHRDCPSVFSFPGIARTPAVPRSTSPLRRHCKTSLSWCCLPLPRLCGHCVAVFSSSAPPIRRLNSPPLPRNYATIAHRILMFRDRPCAVHTPLLRRHRSTVFPCRCPPLTRSYAKQMPTAVPNPSLAHAWPLPGRYATIGALYCKASAPSVPRPYVVSTPPARRYNHMEFSSPCTVHTSHLPGP